MNNMWRLNITGIKELIDDSDHQVSWEIVTQKGTSPSKISHHKPAVFGHYVVIIGGIQDSDNNPNAYEFDAYKHSWSKLK